MNSEKNFLQKKYKWLARKSYVLENYCLKKDNVSYNNIDCTISDVKDLLKSKNYWLAYMGSLQFGRNIELLIRAFSKSKNNNLGLLLAGKDKIGIKNLQKRYGNSAIVYVGNLSCEEARSLYEHIDFGFMDYSNDVINTKYCAPLKLYEYLQHNLAIICNKNTAMLEKENLIDFFFETEEELIEIIDNLNKLSFKEKVH